MEILSNKQMKKIDSQIDLLNKQINLLKEQKNRLYDKEVKKKFSKGDLVIFEDEDPNTKFVFHYAENGLVYGQPVEGGKKMQFTTSRTLLSHWKKL